MRWKTLSTYRLRLIALLVIVSLTAAYQCLSLYKSGQQLHTNTNELAQYHLPTLLQLQEVSACLHDMEQLLLLMDKSQDPADLNQQVDQIRQRFTQAITPLSDQSHDEIRLENIDALFRQQDQLIQNWRAQRPSSEQRHQQLLHIDPSLPQVQTLLQQMIDEHQVHTEQVLTRSLNYTRTSTGIAVGLTLLIAITAFMVAAALTRVSIDQKEQRKMASFADQNPEPILRCRRNGQILYRNAAANELFAQLRLDDKHPLPDLVENLTDIGELGLLQKSWTLQLDSLFFTVQAVLLPEDDQVQLHIKDESQAALARAELSHRASHDALTDLPNRMQFIEDVQALLKHDDRPFTLGLVTITQFQRVTSQIGFQSADEIMQQISQRLLRALRRCRRGHNPSMLYRFEGTHFALLLVEQYSEERLNMVANEFKQEFSPPFLSDDELHTFYLSVDQGFVRYPKHCRSLDGLLKFADIAVREAGLNTEATYLMFSPEMKEREQSMIELENELRHAEQQQQLMLHYQPQQTLSNDTLSGAEALIRWRHPDKGLISPADFIPVAEQSGLILSIGDWVLRQACQQAHHWHQQGYPLLVSINLSAKQFQQPDFVDKVAAILQETQVDPAKIELELTESLLMEDMDHAYDTLTKLKALGVKLAIDDFGTGYSSLAYLKRFPVDTLKIDRSFVANLPGDSQDSAIISAILDLAQHLELKVVAEGVETQEQHDWLQQRGCDVMQGFWYSRPLASQDWKQLLAAHDTVVHC
ncbi:putative bifunctional diguanylate cyclase/phosphodiesterase [Ferrimonas pelagia]|uniref:Uncharacterized protein n=1 Tax=Ferrimonas pelagia TaxID=1177826 RepID=A0ABP9EHN8_9GAMM